MVLDREHKIVYACLSPRTNKLLLNEFCNKFGYEPLIFHSTDSSGIAVYHTNVMMCVAKTFAVVCLESIPDSTERMRLFNSMNRTGKEVIEITLDQMNRFAGNMLQIVNNNNETLVVMSTQAFQALSPLQLEIIMKNNRIIHSSLNTIETAGGGSARCMIAEIFLNRK